MRIYILILVALSLFTSCKTDHNKQLDEGTITENTYQSKDIGWTMEVPEGWDVTHKSDLNERTKKGLDLVTDAVGVEIDASGLKHLLNLQKNKFNLFQSTSEPFEIEYEGEWEENASIIKELIYFTYIENGITSDSTETKIINIDGLDFQSYEFRLYNSDGAILLNQLVYSRLINGFDFGVNINYNNETDKKELLDVWLNSKFEK